MLGCELLVCKLAVIEHEADVRAKNPRSEDSRVRRVFLVGRFPHRGEMRTAKMKEWLEKWHL